MKTKPKTYTTKLSAYYKKRLFEYLIDSIKWLDEKSDEDIKKVRRAYNLAFVAHKKQRRKGGEKEPYITHPVEVAIIVANEMGLGIISIISALLHDVVEDSEYDLEYINSRFGKKVSIIVDGVTKITKISGQESTEQIKTFEKMLFSIPEDARVIFIKIADRLHNMRTMEDMPSRNQKIKSSENLYIYAPITNAVGLHDIKQEIQDLSFQYLYNKEYQNLLLEEKDSCRRRNKVINDFQITLYNILTPEFPNIQIHTVKRSLYSAWQKMIEEDCTLANVHNFHSTRIVINKKYFKGHNIRGLAFLLFEKITEYYELREGSIRDWILLQKTNGFSAFVFDVIDKKGHWLEVQILSEEKDLIARRGFTNFGEKLPLGISNIITGISEINKDRPIVEVLQDFLKDLKQTSAIYIFTPTNERIELPRNSTVLDLAFKIHSDLGFHCIGAQINKKKTLISPTYKLKTTDRVEILTSQTKKPEEEWLRVVSTQRAKRILRNYFNKESEKKLIKKDIKIIKVKEINFNPRKPLIIDDSITYTLSSCCQPIEGDYAVAFNKSGEIIIHKTNCEHSIALQATNRRNITDVIWKPLKEHNAHLTSIKIEGADRVGILIEVVKVISHELSINMHELNFKSSEGFFKGKITIYVYNPTFLDKLIKKLQKIEDIISVERVI